MVSDYVELTRLVNKEGLLEKDYLDYIIRTAQTLTLLSISVLILVSVNNFLIQILNAVFLAVITVQFGGLMHDSMHEQIFKTKKYNQWAGLVFGNFFMQLSSKDWAFKHVQHHLNPNDVEEDPDINVPLLSFTVEQAKERKGIMRSVTKYQAWLWLPIMTTAAVSVRVGSMIDLLKRKGMAGYEWIPISLGTGFFFTIIFANLSLFNAAIFSAVWLGFTGVYFGSIFATNHKGMPVHRPGSPEFDFVRKQVLTSRNVKGNWFVDWWFCGLNYQIEHHLFTKMPRSSLKKAREVVKHFCWMKGISYAEEDFINSYKEVLKNFDRIGQTVKG